LGLYCIPSLYTGKIFSYINDIIFLIGLEATIKLTRSQSSLVAFEVSTNPVNKPPARPELGTG
jgi:hypothetical protein